MKKILLVVATFAMVSTVIAFGLPTPGNNKPEKPVLVLDGAYTLEDYDDTYDGGVSVPISELWDDSCDSCSIDGEFEAYMSDFEKIAIYLEGMDAFEAGDTAKLAYLSDSLSMYAEVEHLELMMNAHKSLLAGNLDDLVGYLTVYEMYTGQPMTMMINDPFKGAQNVEDYAIAHYGRPMVDAILQLLDDVYGGREDVSQLEVALERANIYYSGGYLDEVAKIYDEYKELWQLPTNNVKNYKMLNMLGRCEDAKRLLPAMIDEVKAMTPEEDEVDLEGQLDLLAAIRLSALNIGDLATAKSLNDYIEANAPEDFDLSNVKHARTVLMRLGEGEYAAQLPILESLLDNDEYCDWAKARMGVAYARTGQEKKAREIYEWFLENVKPEGAYNAGHLGLLAAQLGDREMAMKCAEGLMAVPSNGAMTAVSIYSMLGEGDLALKAADASLASGMRVLGFLLYDPEMEGARQHPDFARTIQKYYPQCKI